MEVPLRWPAVIVPVARGGNPAKTTEMLWQTTNDTAYTIAVLSPTTEAPSTQVDSTKVEDLMGQVEHFARRAAHVAAQGKEALLLAGFDCLAPMRLALLGANRAHLPVLAAVQAHMGDNPDGETAGGDSLLSCLICAQKLGAAAFGIVWQTAPAEAPAWLGVLRAHAHIPLMAMGQEPFSSPQIQALLAMGFQAVSGTEGDIASLQNITAQQPAPSLDPAFADRIILCDSQNVYYVEEEFAFSEPLQGHMDMSEPILDAENEGADVLLFYAEDTEDAEHLCGNFHMARTAVAVQAEDGAALEQALLGYHGCAIIDARSDVPEEEQLLLAKGYGAVIR